MPNPYHDRLGRFTTKSGSSGGVGNFGGSSGGLNRARLTEVRRQRQAAAGGARNAQRQRALGGVDRRLGAAADKAKGAPGGVPSSRDQQYLTGRMARTREAVAKVNDSRARDYGVSTVRNPAARPNGSAKRPGGSGGPRPADSADLASLRGRLDKPKETLDQSVNALMKGRGGTMGAVADGLAKMGLGKSEEAKAVRAKEAAGRAVATIGRETMVMRKKDSPEEARAKVAAAGARARARREESKADRVVYETSVAGAEARNAIARSRRADSANEVRRLAADPKALAASVVGKGPDGKPETWADRKRRLGIDQPAQSAKVESAAEYNARLANDRVNANKARNRAAGRKPLPKGYNANAIPIKVVDVPSTGRGKTHTQAIQEKMDRQAAENAKLSKPDPNSDWMKKARAQAEAAMKPVSNSSSNSAKLANVAKIYGKNSPEYKSARRTLFGKR